MRPESLPGRLQGAASGAARLSVDTFGGVAGAPGRPLPKDSGRAGVAPHGDAKTGPASHMNRKPQREDLQCRMDQTVR